jgi:hypothetical protein
MIAAAAAASAGELQKVDPVCDIAKKVDAVEVSSRPKQTPPPPLNLSPFNKKDPKDAAVAFFLDNFRQHSIETLNQLGPGSQMSELAIEAFVEKFCVAFFDSFMSTPSSVPDRVRSELTQLWWKFCACKKQNPNSVYQEFLLNLFPTNCHALRAS